MGGYAHISGPVGSGQRGSVPAASPSCSFGAPEALTRVDCVRGLNPRARITRHTGRPPVTTPRAPGSVGRILEPPPPEAEVRQGVGRQKRTAQTRCGGVTRKRSPRPRLARRYFCRVISRFLSLSRAVWWQQVWCAALAWGSGLGLGLGRKRGLGRGGRGAGCGVRLRP